MNHRILIDWLVLADAGLARNAIDRQRGKIGYWPTYLRPAPAPKQETQTEDVYIPPRDTSKPPTPPRIINPETLPPYIKIRGYKPAAQPKIARRKKAKPSRTQIDFPPFEEESTEWLGENKEGQPNTPWNIAGLLRNYLQGNRKISEDALQEAFCFYWQERTEHETVVPLAALRAASRVNRGQSITYAPTGRQPRWLGEPDSWRDPLPETLKQVDPWIEPKPEGQHTPRQYRAQLRDDDYTGRPGLLARQEFRIEQFSEAEIDAVFSAYWDEAEYIDLSRCA
jgi:hypothetical protein